jgi:hypothetical protein
MQQVIAYSMRANQATESKLCDDAAPVLAYS